MRHPWHTGRVGDGEDRHQRAWLVAVQLGVSGGGPQHVAAAPRHTCRAHATRGQQAAGANKTKERRQSAPDASKERERARRSERAPGAASKERESKVHRRAGKKTAVEAEGRGARDASARQALNGGGPRLFTLNSKLITFIS